MARPVDDQLLVQAMRKRILDEINRREEAKQAAIVNNIHNGGGHHTPMHGVADQMGGMSEGEDPYDYFVDITRKDLPDVNPATGKPLGWEKSVHRHRKKKSDGEPPRPKGSERRRMTPKEAREAMLSDIDPLKHAGEGWFSTEEYANPADIGDPYTRGEVGHEGAYYPGPDKKKPSHKRYMK